MKAFLMYRDRDLDLQQALPSQAEALIQDLELSPLFASMARGDAFLFEVARKVILSSVTDLATIRYRQHILQDCLQHSSIIREMYALAVEAIESERKNFWGLLSKYPTMILHRSVEVLEMFVGKLTALRTIAVEHAGTFASEGFTTFFAMLRQELNEEYFACVQEHLRALKLRNGVLMSARLGLGNKGINYLLRKPLGRKRNWIDQLFADTPPVYRFRIDDRDESGSRALAELKDRGLNLVANALAQSNDHILSFFRIVRAELAFYIGCLNLHEELARRQSPVTFPDLVTSSERRHTFQGLSDVSLALTTRQRVVSNRVNADGKDLVIITGANQGGKSTFLRSIGLAQLMMQCGMFVTAESFCANVCEGIFTHARRKEDASMESGKLDEELRRMSELVETITPNALLLLNESFAATNEREGSEIARQITSALVESHIKVFFVTHLYTFAHGFSAHHLDNALFLRAERQADGRRSFQVTEGEPLQTSYGEDLYRQIFQAGE